jgi:hypothetical protein
MKKLRIFLMVMAAPAALLLTTHELGNTPISKGYDTGFCWRIESNKRLVLSVDASGNINCWLRLKIPVIGSSIAAKTSGNVPLRVTQQSANGRFMWLEVTKDSTVPEDKFDWPSGATVSLDFGDASVKPEVEDWYVYPSNQSFDSLQRARWRRFLIWISLALLALSISGGTLEAVERYREKRKPFSPQVCLQMLILGIEGDDKEDSGQMRTILEKVLIEGSTVQEAMAPLKLGPLQGQIFWLRTGGRFRFKLQFLIKELNRYLSRL